MSNEESDYCDDPVAYQAWEDRMMAEYGWLIHNVHEDPQSPTGLNVHTHGLVEKFGHDDLQVVIPVPEKVSNGIIHAVVNRIKQGESFWPEEQYSGIVHGYDVTFIHAMESGRRILRIILPDKEGRLARDQIQAHFDLQYEGTEELVTIG